jgi:mRNA-degrading endonuclease RelE of RelBE toxin-antitoxin system
LPKPKGKRGSWRATTLAKARSVLQTPTFKKAVKKLKPNQKMELDVAVKALMAKPDLGEQKKGDLGFLRVYKFKMNKQLTLLGYSFNDGTLTLELITLGSHENFYRDIKRRT